MKAKYDPKEDRMLLVLRPGDPQEKRVWVTRRQWLALYRQVAAKAPKGEPAPKAPPVQPKPMAADEISGAVMLTGMRFKPTDDGAQLGFATAKGNVGLTLKAEGLARIRKMLEVQADRAGWDAPAAMKRMAAGALAGAAVKRAKS